jgi:hypothetical protein
MQQHYLLQQYVIEAQQQPLGSIDRQKALMQLCYRLRKLMSYPANPCLSLEEYCELCEEAEQRTIKEVCRKLDTYDHRQFTTIAWLDDMLRSHFRRVFKELYPNPDQMAG